MKKKLEEKSMQVRDASAPTSAIAPKQKLSTQPATPAAAPVAPKPGANAAGVPTGLTSHLPKFLRLGIVEARVGGGWLWSKISGVFHHPAPPPDAKTGTGRAQSSWQALQQNFGVSGMPGLYTDPASKGLYPTAVWSQGQAIGGALDLANLTGDYTPVNQTMSALQYYGNGGAYCPGINGGARYYDDNAWVGLDFMQAYSQTGNKDYLQKAEAMFPYMQTGLHPDGGLHWVEQSDSMSRNTCSNGPAIEYALRLYQATHDQKYLKFAQNCYDFMQKNLRAPDGMYYDSLNDKGGLSKDFWTYNQGTPIGADVMFYRVTGDKKYLQDAQKTANAALAYYSQGDRLWKSPPCFNAIFFRNLLALDHVAPDPRYRQLMDSYLQRAWTQGRDPKTGLFNQGGIGHYGDAGGDVLDQGAFMQMYALQDLPQDRLNDVA
ncbi:MAG TPA: glycoside hydrolase family 76 protein [Oscillatoriaceae cyanobacterium]